MAGHLQHRGLQIALVTRVAPTTGSSRRTRQRKTEENRSLGRPTVVTQGLRREEIGRSGKGTGRIGSVGSLAHEAIGRLAKLPT